MSDRINKVWLSYLEQVIPKEATATQVIECRRAFFAGSQGLLTVLLTLLDPDQAITRDDENMLAEIVAELDQFVLDTLEGRA